MLCTLTFDQGRNVLMSLLLMHLVAEVLILPPRWGERNNWQPEVSLVHASPSAVAGKFPGLCYIPKEAEGRAACLASELGKACAAASS